MIQFILFTDSMFGDIARKRRASSAGRGVSSTTHLSRKLERHSQLNLKCARSHKVSPAESREEVIQRYLVGDIDGRKPQRHLFMVRAEQIVRSNAHVE